MLVAGRDGRASTIGPEHLLSPHQHDRQGKAWERPSSQRFARLQSGCRYARRRLKNRRLSRLCSGPTCFLQEAATSSPVCFRRLWTESAHFRPSRLADPKEDPRDQRDASIRWPASKMARVAGISTAAVKGATFLPLARPYPQQARPMLSPPQHATNACPHQLLAIDTLLRCLVPHTNRPGWASIRERAASGERSRGLLTSITLFLRVQLQNIQLWQFHKR